MEPKDTRAKTHKAFHECTTNHYDGFSETTVRIYLHGSGALVSEVSISDPDKEVLKGLVDDYLGMTMPAHLCEVH